METSTRAQLLGTNLFIVFMAFLSSGSCVSASDMILIVSSVGVLLPGTFVLFNFALLHFRVLFVARGFVQHVV